MQPIIKNNLEAIKALCVQNKLKHLFLFGSATNNSFSHNSDVDFLIDYNKDEEELPLHYFDYFDLKFGFEKLLGRKVDLVTADALKNSYIIDAIKKSKILIYEDAIIE